MTTVRPEPLRLLKYTCWSLLVIVLLTPQPASADYLEVHRSATLKAAPQAGAAVVGRPALGAFLGLLDPLQTNGYYHAQLDTETSGWIYRSFVRRFPGSPPGPTGANGAGSPARLGAAVDPGAGAIPSGAGRSGAGTAATSDIHSPNCLSPCPAGASVSNDIIARDIYTLSNNGDTKFADWVAYRVEKRNLGSQDARNWKKDPLLPNTRTLEPEDYDRSNETLGTDRGHQAPLATFSGTLDWALTNLLSNITPQMADLNQGSWKALEDAERALARSISPQTLYVLTGPLYERAMPQLPEADEAHRIPSAYWKVVAMEVSGALQVASFAFDQKTPRKDKFCAHLTTIDNVEKRSGLNFFRALPDTIEGPLEAGPGALAPRLGCAGN